MSGYGRRSMLGLCKYEILLRTAKLWLVTARWRNSSRGRVAIDVLHGSFLKCEEDCLNPSGSIVGW